jgi:hypothetical protein
LPNEPVKEHAALAAVATIDEIMSDVSKAENFNLCMAIDPPQKVDQIKTKIY